MCEIFYNTWENLYNLDLEGNLHYRTKRSKTYQVDFIKITNYTVSKSVIKRYVSENSGIGTSEKSAPQNSNVVEKISEPTFLTLEKWKAWNNLGIRVPL